MLTLFRLVQNQWCFISISYQLSVELVRYSSQFRFGAPRDIRSTSFEQVIKWFYPRWRQLTARRIEALSLAERYPIRASPARDTSLAAPLRCAKGAIGVAAAEARLKPATTVSAGMTYALPSQNGPRSTRDEFWHLPSGRASFLAISGLSRCRPTLSAICCVFGALGFWGCALPCPRYA